MKNTDLKELHGKEYAKRFKENQDPYRLKRLFENIELPKSAKIIDIGCGNGMLYPLVSGRVDAYTGVDFSEAFIEDARKRKANINTSTNYVCEDVITYCMNNIETFDIAFALDISEHVPDREWVNILSAIHASLKIGGRLYIHTPNAEFFLEKMKENSIILKQFPEHIAVRCAKKNIELLKTSGFEQNIHNYIPHYNILRILHPLTKLPFIGYLFNARILITSTKS